MNDMYPKIDIYVNGKYVASTNRSRTCHEAVRRYKNTHGGGDVKAKFASKKRVVTQPKSKGAEHETHIGH